MKNVLMNNLDKDIKELIIKKHKYYVDKDNEKILTRKFNNIISEIDNKLRELNIQKIKQLNDEIDEREKLVSQKQQKIDLEIQNINQQDNIKNNKQKNIIYKKNNDNIKLYKKIKDKKQLRQESYTKLIIYALRLPMIDNEDKVVAMVLDWKPGIHNENLKKQIRNIISGIKQQKQKRFKIYSWDFKKYMVIKKCQIKLD
jgi:hypothetical protein